MNWIDKAEMKQAWGEWLNGGWLWEWYGTFTFRGEVGPGKANALWDKSVKKLKKVCPDVQYVRCSELQGRGVIHYHALLINVEGARRFSCMDFWYSIAGIARIYPYNANLGASYYLCKYVVKELGEVKFSDGLEDFATWASHPEQLKIGL